jgi:opacity protein-like surface antigen
MGWFAGGSIGYLTELEEPMYNIHVGVTNSCWMLGGWNVSAFAEVGYAQRGEDFRRQDGLVPLHQWSNEFSIDKLETLLQSDANRFNVRTSYDLDIIPITLNAKFERALTGNLNAYLGAGLGMAYVNLDLTTVNQYIKGNSLKSFSESDWVFYTQVFGGLSYNVTPAFEIYGGARWIYIDDANWGNATLTLGSDWLIELGARYKF